MTDVLAYSPENAARKLDISERFIWKLIKNGELDSFKCGRRRLISRRAIESYIDKCEFEAN